MVKLVTAMSDLFVESLVTPVTHDPLVSVTYEDKTVTMGASQATQRAIAIMSAAAYAEAEAAVFLGLVSSKSSKGFGKTSDKDVQMGVALLHMVRGKRSPLPDGVQAIFGFNNQKPFVVLDYKEFQITLELDDARHHSLLLLEASEASRFDSFWYTFGQNELDLTPEERQAVVQEYKLYKERYAVQSLFDLNS